jgi:hypothetical protein
VAVLVNCAVESLLRVAKTNSKRHAREIVFFNEIVPFGIAELRGGKLQMG